MNDAEGYIYFDGPEPEPLRSLLDDVRDLPPLTREDKALMERRLFDAIDTALGYAREPCEVPSAPAPVAPPPSAGMPPVVRQPANLASTAPAAVPDGARTPSVSPPKSDTPARGPALKTQELPVIHVEKNDMKETAPLGDDRFAVALRAIPFVGNTVGTATVHIPPMSLAQFAAFQAELAFWPTYPDWVDINTRWRTRRRTARSTSTGRSTSPSIRRMGPRTRAPSRNARSACTDRGRDATSCRCGGNRTRRTKPRTRAPSTSGRGTCARCFRGSAVPGGAATLGGPRNHRRGARHRRRANASACEPLRHAW